jgi:hypothetical protein
MKNDHELIKEWPLEQKSVIWADLKEQLMQLSPSILADLIDMWVKNYWTNQSYWVTLVERDFGEKEAVRLDGEVWENTARIQAYRLKQILELDDDMRSLAITLQLSAVQWVQSGFEWEFTEISPDKLIITVSKCPMATYRNGLNLQLFPCKIISPPLYQSIAKVINERIQVSCLHAHPDPAKEDVLCQWEFTLK